MNALINLDVTAEANWFERVLKQVKTRIVFTHNDVNRSNTLVKVNDITPNSGKTSWDEKIVLIDYEFSSYKPRGVDIGKHFGLQVHDFGQSRCLMHKPYPSEERRKAFAQSYAEECKRLGVFSDWDEDGLDSPDHIVLEAEIGMLSGRFGMLAWLQFIVEKFAKKLNAQRDADPEFIDQGSAASFVFWYQEREAAFLQRYPQFN